MICQHFGLLCLSVAVVLAAIILACANSYSATSNHTIALDKWTDKGHTMSP